MSTTTQIMREFSNRYKNACSPREQNKIIEELMNFMESNTLAQECAESVTNLVDASTISMNTLYHGGAAPDMKLTTIPLRYLNIPYHNGEASPNGIQRGKIGNKAEPAYLHKIKAIIANPISAKFGYITANYDTAAKRLEVLDGASRVLVLTLLGVETALCGIFVDLTPTQKREVFLNQYELNTRVQQSDMFIVECGSDDPKYNTCRMVKEVAQRYGVTVYKDPTINHNCTSTTVLKNFADKYGKSGLEWVFEVIKDAGYHDYKPTYRRHFLSTLTYAYSKLEEAKKVTTNPRKVLINDLKKYGEPDKFKANAILSCNNEFTTIGKNGEGPMKDYILKLWGLHK